MVQDDPDKQRIAELEREVARLSCCSRESLRPAKILEFGCGLPAALGTQLGGEPGEPTGSTMADVPGADPLDEEARALVPPTSRIRVVVLSALVVAIALGAMFAIFQAISSAIQSIAPRAASFVSEPATIPEAPGRAPAAGADPGASPPPKRPVSADEDLPRAPGL